PEGVALGRCGAVRAAHEAWMFGGVARALVSGSRPDADIDIAVEGDLRPVLPALGLPGRRPARLGPARRAPRVCGRPPGTTGSGPAASRSATVVTPTSPGRAPRPTRTPGRCPTSPRPRAQQSAAARHSTAQ